jgi:hypothetical protein
MEGRASDAARECVFQSAGADIQKNIHFFLLRHPNEPFAPLPKCRSPRDLFALFFFALLYTCARCQRVEREKIVGESLAERTHITHG